MSVGSWWLALGLVAVGLAVASCGSASSPRPALSLDEAKRITAQIQSQTPVPPRSIADITAILDQQKPDPARAEAYRMAANAIPTAGADAAALTHFYFDRGIAAGELGRTPQLVADLRQAAALGRQAGIPIDRILQNLAAAEPLIGNAASALRVLREWQAVIPPNIYGERLGNTSLFAIVYAAAGDFAAASSQLDAAKQQLAAAPTAARRVWPTFAEDWTSVVEKAEATVLAARGRFAEAEMVERDGIANISKAIEKYEDLIRANPSPFPREQIERARDVMQLELSRILIAEGRVLDAEIEIRRLLLSLLHRRGRDAPETAAAVVVLAVVLEHEGRYREAERLGRAAVAIDEALGAGAGSWALAVARGVVAETEVAQGRWSEALTTYEAIEQLLGDDARGQEKFVRGNLARAVAYINLHQPDAAIAILRRVAERTENAFGPTNAITAEAHGMLGAALAETGQREAAFAEFKAAVPVLLRNAREATDDSDTNAARDRRRQVIFEAYIGALADAQGTPLAAGLGDIAAVSFPIADAIRGRSVQRALTASSARAAASDPALADLVRREQDARTQVATLQSDLTTALAAPLDQQDQAALGTLRTTIDALRGARAALREEIERKFPDYVNLIDPRPATIAATQAALRPGEALIATYVGETRSFVWAVPATGTPVFAAVAMDRSAVAKVVAGLRQALEPVATTLGDIPAFDIAAAHRLYRAFLQPVEAGWRGAKNLLVVPHGPLGQLPFAVLVTEAATLQPDRDGTALFANYRTVPFLARSAAITQLPSVAALTAMRAAPPRASSRKPFIGFGDPWFSPAEAAEAARDAAAPLLPANATPGPATLLATRGVRLVRRAAPATETASSAGLAQLPRLPDTADEVRSIAVALAADPVRDVFTGREANERRVRTMDLADRKVVMFATHGLVPGDLDGLTQPALALSSPAVADGLPSPGMGDGLLTLDKVLTLKLNADWVVLSACNTATGDGAGAEAVSGLGRAFFYAGTRAILVSNWPVETNSARALTTDLFRRQALDPALSRAEALRAAEMALVDGPGIVDPLTKTPLFSYAHPIFWAPFSLVGDGG
jgi:CHAT domain-containing protein/tetratricopeptide (TPR) repeat protein